MLSAEIMFRNKGGTAEIIRPLVMKISFFMTYPDLTKTNRWKVKHRNYAAFMT